MMSTHTVVCLVAFVAVVSAIPTGPSDNYRFLDASSSEAKDKCAANSLCSSCLLDSDCIWCADGKGSCVAGSPKGPAVAATCKNFEAEYCPGEPCSVYSNCHICGADPFCGWCSSEKLCVEGDKAGPLTGACPAWEFDKCSKEALAPGATGGGTGIEGTLEGDAAQAIKDSETVAKGMASEANATKSAGSNMANGANGAVNVIRMLKNVIKEWKAKKAEASKRGADDRGFFAKRFEELTAKRKATLGALRKVVDEQYKEELADEALMKKKKEQDQKLDAEGEAADAKLKNTDKDAAASEAGLAGNPSALAKLESWMSSLSARDKKLLKGLKRASLNRVERELHRAANRKMHREEAGWYACAYLLQDQANKCESFHPTYSGQLKGGELTPAESLRLCNNVGDILKSAANRPAYNTNGSVRKDVYLAWCVNNVKLPTP